MAQGQPPETVTGLPLSRASPLPQGISLGQRILAPPQIKCGSWLACDGAGSAASNSDWTAAIAGKPAPTGDLTGAENFGPTTDQMWELACLRWRWVSRQKCWLGWRYRGQARSHRDLTGAENFGPTTDQMWELACLRWRWVSRQKCWLGWRYRGQARSHRDLTGAENFGPTTDQMWELACLR